MYIICSTHLSGGISPGVDQGGDDRVTVGALRAVGAPLHASVRKNRTVQGCVTWRHINT